VIKTGYAASLNKLKLRTELSLLLRAGSETASGKAIPLFVTKPTTGQYPIEK
jgi:hypothetical protein